MCVHECMCALYRIGTEMSLKVIKWIDAGFDEEIEITLLYVIFWACVMCAAFSLASPSTHCMSPIERLFSHWIWRGSATVAALNGIFSDYEWSEFNLHAKRTNRQMEIKLLMLLQRMALLLLAKKLLHFSVAVASTRQNAIYFRPTTKTNIRIQNAAQRKSYPCCTYSNIHTVSWRTASLDQCLQIPHICTMELFALCRILACSNPTTPTSISVGRVCVYQACACACYEFPIESARSVWKSAQ